MNDDKTTDTQSAEVDASSNLLEFVADESSAGTRIDSALAELSGVSRAQVRRWIDAGVVKVAGAAVRPSRRLAVGETIEARPMQPVEMSLVAEAIELDVLFEDADLIVIDKAAGMVVHPAPGHPRGTLVNALLHHCGDLAGIGGVLRPGIVHRLDRGTSGVLVAAKNDATHQGLSRQFADHAIDRVYRTFVRALPGADSGRIDRAIGRHPRDRKRMSVQSRSGRPSITNWLVACRYPSAMTSELEIRPETGRTHQIRVHLAAAGLPLVGDVVYGRARGQAAALGRPALHAEVLGFDHPTTGERMRFEASLPEDLTDLVASLGTGERVSDRPAEDPPAT
jgi:23S rRNA pseudouridine1911/1915/1917 synthase